MLAPGIPPMVFLQICPVDIGQGQMYKYQIDDFISKLMKVV